MESFAMYTFPLPRFNINLQKDDLLNNTDNMKLPKNQILNIAHRRVSQKHLSYVEARLRFM